jgi:hypothetical protein
MTTTITRLKQLRDWLDGKLKEDRVQRQSAAIPNTATITLKQPTVLFALSEHMKIDRFSTYREKIIPTLRICGYGYFLSCDSNDYVEHQRWCDANCIDSSLPHCDVWQVNVKYPRAFANKEDAAMFKITFDTHDI